jgi:hypothetical protein
MAWCGKAQASAAKLSVIAGLTRNPVDAGSSPA